MKTFRFLGLACALAVLISTTLACTPLKNQTQRETAQPERAATGDRVAITGSRIKRLSHRSGRVEKGLSSNVIIIERDEFAETGAQTVGGVLKRRGF